MYDFILKIMTFKSIHAKAVMLCFGIKREEIVFLKHGIKTKTSKITM